MKTEKLKNGQRPCGVGWPPSHLSHLSEFLAARSLHGLLLECGDASPLYQNILATSPLHLSAFGQRLVCALGCLLFKEEKHTKNTRIDTRKTHENIGLYTKTHEKKFRPTLIPAFPPHELSF